MNGNDIAKAMLEKTHVRYNGELYTISAHIKRAVKAETVRKKVGDVFNIIYQLELRHISRNSIVIADPDAVEVVDG